MLAGLKPALVIVTWIVIGRRLGAGVDAAARVGITLAVGVALAFASCVGVRARVAVGPATVDWPEGTAVAAGVDALPSSSSVVTP